MWGIWERNEARSESQQGKHMSITRVFDRNEQRTEKTEPWTTKMERAKRNNDRRRREGGQKAGQMRVRECVCEKERENMRKRGKRNNERRRRESERFIGREEGWREEKEWIERGRSEVFVMPKFDCCSCQKRQIVLERHHHYVRRIMKQSPWILIEPRVAHESRRRAKLGTQYSTSFASALVGCILPLRLTSFFFLHILRLLYSHPGRAIRLHRRSVSQLVSRYVSQSVRQVGTPVSHSAARA